MDAGSARYVVDTFLHWNIFRQKPRSWKIVVLLTATDLVVTPLSVVRRWTQTGRVELEALPVAGSSLVHLALLCRPAVRDWVDRGRARDSSLARVSYMAR